MHLNYTFVFIPADFFFPAAYTKHVCDKVFFFLLHTEYISVSEPNVKKTALNVYKQVCLSAVCLLET